MSKIYQIETMSGTVREGWGEVICDHAEVSDYGVIKFYIAVDLGFQLSLVYKLADGEALIYTGEE